MLIYVAGPYRGYINKNIKEAREVAIKLWDKGHTVICPHLNTEHFEDELPEVDFIEKDLDIVGRCDAIVMTKEWKKSEGARREKEYAESIGIPVYYDPELPELHEVEIKSPVQVRAFRAMQTKGYLLHLEKNTDYTPMNILLTGERGVVNRLWDKLARMFGLYGFNIDIKQTEKEITITIDKKKFEQTKQPRNEAIEDSWIDAANYGIIGLLVRKGLWGR